MIDTLEIYADITHDTYDNLYHLIDIAAKNTSQNKQPLHKYKPHSYKTTAFQRSGVLEIAFCKNKKFKRYTIRLKLKPIRFLHSGSNIKLSESHDFEKISRRFQEFLSSNFGEYVSDLPSSLGEWKVTRIDYAINIPTQNAGTYIKLFHFGLQPKACKSPPEYETSYYLKGTEYNVNFYNKMRQVAETRNISVDDILGEMDYSLVGILRLEIQCKSKYIYRFVEKKRIPSPNLQYLWNKELAEWCLKKTVKRLIGIEDIRSISANWKKLREKNCSNKFCADSFKFMDSFIQYPDISLEDIVQSVPYPQKVKVLVSKLRKKGINPIPLDAIYDTEAVDEDFVLKNPYHLIQFD